MRFEPGTYTFTFAVTIFIQSYPYVIADAVASEPSQFDPYVLLQKAYSL